ncbi:phenol hydroxylase subunit P4 [Mangrovitalea sediminis]|uniref:phenol hydroxylase subunit P4 n=1 Tax=Mangrovitalea sediminis TaxID=1982043 RepID=UPI000BE5C748|nr:phenol hydroxylase subunit P4 [Mangrovitalea sediminis]
MPVTAMYDYQGQPKDVQANFHGNQLVYFGWDKHLMFCAPVCLPLPPDMPFGAVLTEVLPGVYGSHPDWARLDWEQAEWSLDQQPFTPDPQQSLEAQGIHHKSLLRFRVPGLDGIAGSAS